MKKMTRRSTKRKIAFLLAFSMVCNFSNAVCAGAALSNIGGSQESGQDIQLETKEDEPAPIDAAAEIKEALPETEVPTNHNAVGRIDVSIGSALVLEGSVEMMASLSGSDGFAQDCTALLSSSGEAAVSFDGLPDGVYTLNVHAPGFADYTQIITVEQRLYSVRLTAGFSAGYTYEKGGLHPGVLLIGDADGDGDVDDADKNTLVDAIDSGILPEGVVTDLNLDGRTNLEDLVFLSSSLDTEKDTTAAIEERIAPAAIRAAAPERTRVEGDPGQVLIGEGTLTLSPSNGEAISAENPVSLEFDMLMDGSAAMADGITFASGENDQIEEALVDVVYTENGEEHAVTVPVQSGTHYLLKESEVYAQLDENGTIQVHLGSQIAVKKVTLTITAMHNSNTLAEIGKVEFVNGMESRIPEPELDIPEHLTAKAGSEQMTLSWDACVNVTGYEIRIEQGDQAETVSSVSDSVVISGFNGHKLENYTTYTVSVQSVNGAWRSGYCASIDVMPVPSGPPDKPDQVSAAGKYKAVAVSWKKMKDTQSYNVYYKVRNSSEAYTKISGIQETAYTIQELEPLEEYEIYVTGVNELGESPESIHCAAKTTDLDPAQVPRYNMINRDENGIPGRAHIVAAERNGGSMVESTLDEDLERTAWGTLDGNAASYYTKQTWDDGGFNAIGGNGLFYTFDDTYKMDTIALLATEGMQFSYVKIRWWDADGKDTVVTASCQQMKDEQGKIYHVIRLPEPVAANKIQIGLARYLATAAYHLITVSEVYFYRYDDLRDEIMALYVDDLHTVLKDSVTQKTIDDLREKVNTPDEFGEENSNKTALLRELETAEKILNDESLNSAVAVHTDITTKDVGRGFSGLNAWQPLGVSVAAGETVTVYVGHNRKSTGDNTDLRIIATQYHSESGGVVTSGANLKVGANEITFPKGNSSVGAESGGALYIQYQGNNANDRYSVRISGGAEVPVLDLYKVTDESECMERTVAFVEELDAYTAEMESLHNTLHAGSGNPNVEYDYDRQNCILGASEILLDTMLLSLPAQQILAGAGKGTSEQRAETILASMKAMEDMMYLFYQHKGLNETAPALLDQFPKGHLNIRYQRMFSGAFMYASGNHIGIEWNETKGMMQSQPVVSDESGAYVSGRYFGWGIAHEIGHCINQGVYAVAEITNNYFAQLAQAKDSNSSVRFQYSNIYGKVTSGTKGNASNVFTQLGMYWQLHLAYDKGLNYKTYSDYADQLSNLFYARVDTYARNVNAAPAPGGVALTLGNQSDQNLMRLACAAAEKNVLAFFERWGKQPDAETIAYAEQFETETRAIYYANDDARLYALQGKGSVLGSDSSVQAIKDVSVQIGAAANEVEFEFTSAGIPEDDILGYEVIRCTISGGKMEEMPVGFAQDATFTDTVTTMNNRTVFYKVTLIDKYLNRSAVFTTEMVKIEHDGSMDKSDWSIATTGLTAPAETSPADDEMPCEQTQSDPAQQALDHDRKTVYTPQVDSDMAEIVIDFHQTLTVTGMRYTAGEGTPVGAYEAYVLTNDEWVLTAEGTLDGSKTVYFANDDDKYISTYAADALKIVLAGQKGAEVSIAELDVLGVTGDNVDFRRTNTEAAAVIGTLDQAYRYGEDSGDVIPEGSLVFTGKYKGNPAYNVVLLYDENGNIVGGMDAENNVAAQQIILADVPDSSDIANVSDGTWIYWIEPTQMQDMKLPKKVRAELYRVNNALTNEGQRLVSDSLFEEMPDTLPAVTLKK